MPRAWKLRGTSAPSIGQGTRRNEVFVVATHWWISTVPRCHPVRPAEVMAVEEIRAEAALLRSRKQRSEDANVDKTALAQTWASFRLRAIGRILERQPIAIRALRRHGVQTS